MERHSVVNKTCLICCQNWAPIATPTTTTTSTSTSSVPRSVRSRSVKFRRFFEDVDNVYVTPPPTDVQHQTEDETEVDLELCLSCRRILTPAVEAHEKAMETEVRVGQLQRQILKEMKTLQGQLCQFYVEMKKVEQALEKFPGGVEEQANAEASFILRQKIVEVVRDLRLYNAQLLPKIMSCKTEANDHDDDHVGQLFESEMETETEVGTSFDFDLDDVGDSQKSVDCDADLDLDIDFDPTLEMKAEPCEIEMDDMVDWGDNENFADTEVEAEVKNENFSITTAAAAVKAKARRRVKTKWSKSSKYAKPKKTYPKPKPPPRDDEWLPETEISELIRKRKRSESLRHKMKIHKEVQKAKGKPPPPFKKSVVARIIATKRVNPCDICGRPFKMKVKMIRHKITHMNVSERAEATARGEGRGRTLESFLSPIERKNCSEEMISTLREIIGKEKTSDWKLRIICRIIKEGWQTDTDQDSPAAKFPICYDKVTDKLSVSGIEIFMNETEVCLECSSCSVKFHGRNSLQRVELSMHNHILSKHFDALRCPFPEDQCTARIRSFETVTKYNQHLKDCHPKEEQEKVVCETCGKIFKSGPSLNSHLQLHEKAKFQEPKPKSAMRLNLPLKHKCSTCGKGFWCRDQLRRHEVSHLPPEQKKPFICNRCGKRFHLGHYLNRHQKVTCFEKGQELPRVPCQFCPSTLKNKDNLRKHIATIHPEQNVGDERPFQCSMCPQRFMTEWNMEAHEKTHLVAEGGAENGNGHPDGSGSGYRCRKGCGKLIATAHGRKVHESYCDGEGCKTERERSKSKKK